MGRREKKEEISKEKVRKILRKLEEGKAARVDGIPSEVWKRGRGESWRSG